MSSKVDPVDPVGAYSPYLRYTRYLDHAAYSLDVGFPPVQLAQQSQWLELYRKGLYPVGATPLGLVRGSQSPEAQQFGACPQRWVRMHFQHHSVFAGLPRYRPAGEDTWKSLFSAPRAEAPSRAFAPQRPAFSLSAFFARTSPRPETQAFQAPEARSA